MQDMPIPTSMAAIDAVIKELDSQILLDALYFIWDAAERGQLQMFLIGDTARDVMANTDLVGDKITVGVRRNEWESGQGRIAQMFMEHELRSPMKVEPAMLTYTYQGVPIVIKIYEDNPTLMGMDVAFYRYETFNLPNPYSLFKEKYE